MRQMQPRNNEPNTPNVPVQAPQVPVPPPPIQVQPEQAPQPQQAEEQVENDVPPPPQADQPAQPPGIEPTHQTRRYPLRERRANPRYYNDDMVNNATYQTQRRVRFGEINNAFLNSLNWDDAITMLRSADASSFMAEMDVFFDFNTNEVDYFHPLFLSVKANAEDNPRWHEAMNGPDAEGYWRAMEAKLCQLLEKDAWEVVPREQADKVLPSTWTFKCKRFPDGLVRKLKARFCARGDCQVEGVDFFDTYAPVVSWTTVRMLLVLSIVLGSKYKTSRLHTGILPGINRHRCVSRNASRIQYPRKSAEAQAVPIWTATESEEFLPALKDEPSCQRVCSKRLRSMSVLVGRCHRIGLR